MPSKSEEELKFDVIVVGAGPAGTTAAYVLAKAGINVVIFERGKYPGSKNVMGGILYRKPTEDIIPGFWKEAPLERNIIEQKIWIISKDSAVNVGYRSASFDKEPYNCFTVMRAHFDKWFADKAVEQGALLINETVVESLIKENGKVIGVKTGREEGDVYADVVIIADGVNSLLAKEAGFHPEIPPEKVALAVKDTIFLPKEKIEERFNITHNQGVSIELIGQITQGMAGGGFIYTNKESISVGLACLCSDFMKTGITPYDLINQMESHPVIKPLIEGGEIKEYSAHLIPEGGYDAIPSLYGDGYLIAGDAAMLVNPVHREGSNYATTSGMSAANTVIRAKERNDFSAKGLSHYKTLLEESFIMKDLKKYRRVSRFSVENSHMFSLYPEFINQAAHEMITVDGIPKKEKQKKIWKMFKSKRSLTNLIKDAFNIWRSFK